LNLKFDIEGCVFDIEAAFKFDIGDSEGFDIESAFDIEDFDIEETFDIGARGVSRFQTRIMMTMQCNRDRDRDSAIVYRD
jgi:hypothetical protein